MLPSWLASMKGQVCSVYMCLYVYDLLGQLFPYISGHIHGNLHSLKIKKLDWRAKRLASLCVYRAQTYLGLESTNLRRDSICWDLWKIFLKLFSFNLSFVLSFLLWCLIGDNLPCAFKTGPNQCIHATMSGISLYIWVILFCQMCLWIVLSLTLPKFG